MKAPKPPDLRFHSVHVAPERKQKTVAFLERQGDPSMVPLKHSYTQDPDGDITGFVFDGARAFGRHLETRHGRDAKLYAYARAGNVPPQSDYPIYTGVAFQRADLSVGYHLQVMSEVCPLVEPPRTFRTDGIWVLQVLDKNRYHRLATDPTVTGLTSDAFAIARWLQVPQVSIVCDARQNVARYIAAAHGGAKDWKLSDPFPYGKRMLQILVATTALGATQELPGMLVGEWLHQRRAR